MENLSISVEVFPNVQFTWFGKTEPAFTCPSQKPSNFVVPGLKVAFREENGKPLV